MLTGPDVVDDICPDDLLEQALELEDPGLEPVHLLASALGLAAHGRGLDLVWVIVVAVEDGSSLAWLDVPCGQVAGSRWPGVSSRGLVRCRASWD